MKQILTFLLLLCSLTVSAQDIIVKKDGTAIQAVVKEILTSEVKYKKFSNPNGPTYTVATADLLSITYENGDVDRFNSSEPTKEEPAQPTVAPQQESSVNSDYIFDGRRTKSDAELLQIYQNDHPVPIKFPLNTSTDLYNKGKRMKAVGWIVGGTLVAAGVATFLVLCKGDGDYYGDCVEFGKESLISIVPIAIPGFIIGTSLICAGNKKIRQSRSIQTATLLQQEIPLGKHSTLSADVNLMKDSYRNQYAPGLGFHINF